MAYHYALYLEKIASYGRKAYEIPLFTNVWLPQPGEPGAASGGAKPGEYPSGGAASTVLDIWQKFAPHLEFISPDIYHNTYTKTCADYCHRDQPLFIPEQRRDHFGARTAYAQVFGRKVERIAVIEGNRQHLAILAQAQLGRPRTRRRIHRELRNAASPLPK